MCIIKLLSHLTLPTPPSIIHGMKKLTLLSPRLIFVAALSLASLIAFNMNRPLPQSEQLAAFDTWYSATAPSLERSSDPALANRKLSVKIKLSTSNGGDASISNEWSLPNQNLAVTEDRERTTRVLHLISESKVFGLKPLEDLSGKTPYLSLSIADGEQRFDTAVPLREVESEIRLQNLVKLLEVFSSQPIAPAIEPGRL